MAGYKVDIEQHCDESEFSGEQYGDWSESWSNYFKRISKVEADEYPDISSSLDIAPGEEVIVVWVEYSTGDSFGYSVCGSNQPVAIFKDYGAAKLLADAIEAGTTKDWTYSEIYKAADGQEITVYQPWLGYFETLESVHIEHTRVM